MCNKAKCIESQPATMRIAPWKSHILQRAGFVDAPLPISLNLNLRVAEARLAARARRRSRALAAPARPWFSGACGSARRLPCAGVRTRDR